MVNIKWLHAVAAHQRHIMQLNEAAEAERKRRQSTQWAVEFEPPAAGLEAEVKMLREELVKVRHELNVLLTERMLARGRGLHL